MFKTDISHIRFVIVKYKGIPGTGIIKEI